MAHKVRSLFNDELHRKNQHNAHVLSTGPREGQGRTRGVNQGYRGLGEPGGNLAQPCPDVPGWIKPQEKAIL